MDDRSGSAADARGQSEEDGMAPTQTLPRCEACGTAYDGHTVSCDVVETSKPREHRAEPLEDNSRGALVCAVCERPVRTAEGGRFAVHASL